MLSLRLRVLLNPQTRLHAELLGPCFKTGRVSYQLATEQQLSLALWQRERPGRTVNKPHTALCSSPIQDLPTRALCAPQCGRSRYYCPRSLNKLSQKEPSSETARRSYCTDYLLQSLLAVKQPHVVHCIDRNAPHCQEDRKHLVCYSHASQRMQQLAKRPNSTTESIQQPCGFTRFTPGGFTYS